MLKIMLGFSEARHATMDFVEFFAVKSFKLEPLCPGSYITVDGELIDHSNVQAEVIPNSMKILTK